MAPASNPGDGLITHAAPPTKSIRLTDPVPGWASAGGSTTGGGTNLSAAKRVRTTAELAAALKGGGVIVLSPGVYKPFSLGDEELRPESNTTLVGDGPGVIIYGAVRIASVSNIIMRNMAIQGMPCDYTAIRDDRACDEFNACRYGTDALVIRDGAHHVWLDHISFLDGQDGNMDVVEAADYVTASWCHFFYSRVDKGHAFSNLIASGDGETQSAGKLKITYMNNWWGNGVQERAPRGRYGQVHVFNNFYKTNREEGYLIGPGVKIQLLIENNFARESTKKPFINTEAEWVKEEAYLARGNEGTAGGNMNMEKGQVFTPPYQYQLVPASEVENLVTAPNCGAGNHCLLGQ
jgi:pectate lyase